MKLSEAIRLGAMLRLKGKYNYLKHGKSCALGAALEAIGVPLRDRGDAFDRDNEREAIEEFMRRPECKEWSILNTKKNCVCPVCGVVDSGNFTGNIAHLNNAHWTRERIADWVATIEAQDVPVQTATIVQHEEPVAL